MIGNGTKKQISLWIILAALLLGSSARAQELNLRAVYNALGGVMAPIWVANDAALFKKQGVNVDRKYLAATSAVQAMVGGGEEVGFVGNQSIDAKAVLDVAKTPKAKTLKLQDFYDNSVVQKIRQRVLSNK